MTDKNRDVLNRMAVELNRVSKTPLEPYVNKDLAKSHSDYHPVGDLTDVYVGMGSYYVEGSPSRYRLVQVVKEPQNTGTRNISHVCDKLQLMGVMQTLINDRKNNQQY